MYSNQSFFELIKMRKSVRSYTDEKMTREELEKIMKDVKEIKGPFKDAVKLELIVSDAGLNSEGEKLGTYGIIKGAKYYLAAVVNREEQSLYELGYHVEKAILYLTGKNLGTCWLGGTFQRGNFAGQITLEHEEYLPVVVPFGYSHGKQSIQDKIIRRKAASDKRKPWEDLFYNGTTNSPLTIEMAGTYENALEAVRIAPSASNKQPWRIIKNVGSFQFYLKPDLGYGDMLGFKIQEIDIGIAMAHFELVALEEGNRGQWEINLGQPGEQIPDMILVATWKNLME